MVMGKILISALQVLLKAAAAAAALVLPGHIQAMAAATVVVV
jgi:hypothetical protein